MKKNNVKLGSVYAVKVSGSVVPVRLDRENPHGGWDGTNVKTKKQVRIKSPQRLRGLWPKKTTPVAAKATPTSAPKAKRGRKATKDATGQAGRDTGERAATGAKKERPSLLNLAAKALAEAGEPMNCQQMVEKVLATGLWKTKGKTPAATLYSAILRESAKKGEQARFRKVERGKFETAK